VIEADALRRDARAALAEGRHADALARAHEADVFGAPRGELNLVRGLVQAQRGQLGAARKALQAAWAEADSVEVLGQIAEGLRLAGDAGRAVAVALDARARGDARPLRFVLRAPLPDPAAELTGCLVASVEADDPAPWRARAEAASAQIRAAGGHHPPPVGVLLMMAALHAGTPLGARLLHLAWAAGLASPTVQFALLGGRLDGPPQPSEALSLALRLVGAARG
jgi:hypothetical protein